jgi:hypothetical protein
MAGAIGSQREEVVVDKVAWPLYGMAHAEDARRGAKA